MQEHDGGDHPPHPVPLGSPELPARYLTADLYFAAFLRVAGIPFLDVIKDGDGARFHFVFEDKGPAIMRDLRRQYFADEAKVPAQSYGQALRTMKSLIHTNF